MLHCHRKLSPLVSVAVTNRAARPSFVLAPVLGFLAAVIALVSQLALGAALPADGPTPQQIAALNAVRFLCDGSPPSAPGGKPDHDHRPLAPAICPISVTLSLPSILPTPAPVLPAPLVAVPYVRRLDQPPGRGPPPATARVGVPRAPPLSI